MSVFCLTMLYLAIGAVAVAASLTDGLLQDDQVLPLRRQVSNSSRPRYELVETYDASNFWDKFDFIEVHPPAALWRLRPSPQHIEDRS